MNIFEKMRDGELIRIDMKAFIITLMLAFSANLASCSPVDSTTGDSYTENVPDPPVNIENMKLKITIGNQTLTATLMDNPTARDFISLLPLTVELKDYVNTEKIFNPPQKLSTKDAPASIEPMAGDITYFVPWGNIAIFYKDFRRSSNLIRIGKIENGMGALQVSGSIENVTFELIENN